MTMFLWLLFILWMIAPFIIMYIQKTPLRIKIIVTILWVFWFIWSMINVLENQDTKDLFLQHYKCVESRKGSEDCTSLVTPLLDHLYDISK